MSEEKTDRQLYEELLGAEQRIEELENENDRLKAELQDGGNVS